MTEKKRNLSVDNRQFLWILVTAFIVISIFTITLLVNDENYRVVPQRSYANPAQTP